MNEFILPIEIAKFRSTNQTWNDLMLNDPWSVGYVTSLIVIEEFVTKEDWELFYYTSGEKRNHQIQHLNDEQRVLVNDEQLVLKNGASIRKLSWDLKNLNFQFGRTEEQLYRKGELLHGVVKNNGYDLTIEDCFQCVRFRVICETWNGVVVREVNTIATLKGLLPQADFRKVEGEFDHKYAVDYEVFKNDHLIYGLQIKPESYTRNAPYINKARFANQQKNQQYKAKYGVPVYDIIAGSSGNIINQEILKNL
ncbi:MjaI family restriction endonuclease [Mucilaginibacter sp. SJ]|uniref:MjaI family restriction endonuclease n=1 Tax=Mucilaginibacter sp. SJ TaxID=3029053 RepID=UPI0023A98876|nr:MjaI family restriction endonuclease [Mucilaginibacter sp. SJ]WDZ99705.1 MjaI family restriction endonuclease [Mucilaginibacter sp. SJ]